jgi:protease I
MSTELQGKTIAIVATEGVEQVELVEPRKALEEAGARTVLISPATTAKIKAWNSKRWGRSYAVEQRIGEARPEDYDALLLPGGVMNPDKLRRMQPVLDFVKSFFEAGKPVAAICHAPWTLIDAGVVKGLRLTSYHSVQTDLKNAGADWVDEEVVEDRNLVTSRSPQDIPAFNRRIIEKFQGPASERAQRGGEQGDQIAA